VLGAVKTFCSIAAGQNHSITIDKNGRLWCWGNNGAGQLGDNTIVSKRTPVSVLGAVKTFCKIAGGAQHTLAIDKNGRLWSWGNNFVGQLGDNTVTSRRTPVSVSGTVKTFCHIYASVNSNSSFGLDKNGQLWAWGNNSAGQLGTNSNVSARTPVSVLGTKKTFCQISAGDIFTVAIDQYGKAWGWGAGSSGQLGNNSTLIFCTPVSVQGNTRTFCKIVAGSTHTIAVDKNGLIWGWGAYFQGMLGNNLNTKTPILISNL
jgi:alpha-tubulin suppressor-like RCC1 family protein